MHSTLLGMAMELELLNAPQLLIRNVSHYNRMCAVPMHRLHGPR